jgi:creatinine amidohydrolase/Fe(II)-dependent formamide hydrolase-like protein
LMASPYGHLVNIAAAERGFVGDARARMRELRAKGEFFIDDISPVGVLGDPRGATVEAGREIVEAFVNAYTQIIKDALATN